MTTRSLMSVLRLMGNMEQAARDAAISDGEKVSVTRDGTIRDRAVSVTYTWSRRKDGAGLERWTWRLDGKRINSTALSELLESLPVALATGAACKPVPTRAAVPVMTRRRYVQIRALVRANGRSVGFASASATFAEQLIFDSLYEQLTSIDFLAMREGWKPSKGESRKQTLLLTMNQSDWIKARPIVNRHQ